MRTTVAGTASLLPSTVKRALSPTFSAARSCGATAASSSSRARSTISRMRASTATRSPGWARRCAMSPAIGAVKTVSDRDFLARSTPACAAIKLAIAPASLETEVSSAVGEMKPCATSALLLVSWRWAISSWARAAAACCSAWRRRKSNSVASSWPSTWPARTLSPSRTSRRLTSEPTRALTNALLIAFRLPDTSSPRVRLTRCRVSTSCAASSRVGAAALAADAAAAAPGAPVCACLLPCIQRAPKKTTINSASKGSNQRSQGFMSGTSNKKNQNRGELGGLNSSRGRRCVWGRVCRQAWRRFRRLEAQPLQHQINVLRDEVAAIKVPVQRTGAQ